jgi:RNA exonuclease 4
MIFGQPLVESQVPQLSRVVAIDCEMVGVGPPIGYRRHDGRRVPDRRSALARVSIVDLLGRIVLDAYVRPSETVMDFRTSVSGIRPSDLNGENAIPFATARALVSRVLKDRIIVGHAVHNDLRVRSCVAIVSVSKLD